ncbi:hypothetical protein BOX15_Mlig000936g2 [Macrostomum lignano]|uniref:Small monomeric GTPase n=3 Tax=Macrostomum lignano TaxID=282301 RepID=A0A1I8H3S9_9PLAT|nr:hypothetical protein BOX15_Mlig000936g1 [Macrostomum lignano]PAA75111.1 hypothetical protein BOX15_Mlig000936g5 [Macrostomum lignano]PAA82616.1 hypothetical protein BOX15_Mlig000936g2 [Macrostomum lignano]
MSKSVSKSVKPIKIVVIGSGGVGKSALTLQFSKSKFFLDYDPTIEDSFSKSCYIDNEMARLDILDTAGQEEFTSMREQYMRLGQAFLVVFSVTDRKGFEEVDSLIQLIYRVKDREAFPIMVAGNKIDLQNDRCIDQSLAQELVQRHQEFNPYCAYIETSAKTRLNVDLVFHDLVRLLRLYNAKGGSKQAKKSKCSLL